MGPFSVGSIDGAEFARAATQRKKEAAEELRASELEYSLVRWQCRLRDMEERLRTWEATAKFDIALNHDDEALQAAIGVLGVAAATAAHTRISSTPPSRHGNGLDSTAATPLQPPSRPAAALQLPLAPPPPPPVQPVPTMVSAMPIASAPPHRPPLQEPCGHPMASKTGDSASTVHAMAQPGFVWELPVGGSVAAHPPPTMAEVSQPSPLVRKERGARPMAALPTPQTAQVGASRPSTPWPSDAAAVSQVPCMEVPTPVPALTAGDGTAPPWPPLCTHSHPPLCTPLRSSPATARGAAVAAAAVAASAANAAAANAAVAAGDYMARRVMELEEENSKLRQVIHSRPGSIAGLMSGPISPSTYPTPRLDPPAQRPPPPPAPPPVPPPPVPPPPVPPPPVPPPPPPAAPPPPPAAPPPPPAAPPPAAPPERPAARMPPRVFQAFDKFDVGQRGFIDRRELGAALHQCGIDLSASGLLGVLARYVMPDEGTSSAQRSHDETLMGRDETLMGRDETLMGRDETLMSRDEFDQLVSELEAAMLRSAPVPTSRYDLEAERYDLEAQRYDLEAERRELEAQRYDLEAEMLRSVKMPPSPTEMLVRSAPLAPLEPLPAPPLPPRHHPRLSPPPLDSTSSTYPPLQEPLQEPLQSSTSPPWRPSLARPSQEPFGEPLKEHLNEPLGQPWDGALTTPLSNVCPGMLSMEQLTAAQEAAAERALRGYDAAGRPGGRYSAQQPPPGMEFGGYLKGCVGVVWMPAGANARPSDVHSSSCAAAAAAFTDAAAFADAAASTEASAPSLAPPLPLPPPPPPPASARDGARQPASAPPPGARDGACAPPPPAMSVVAFTLKLAGDVSSFTPSVQAEITYAIAAEASVQPSAVEIAVTSGSVIVDVSIQTPTATATSVQSKMASATSSPSSATAMLASVTGVQCAVIAISKPATLSAMTTAPTTAPIPTTTPMLSTALRTAELTEEQLAEITRQIASATSLGEVQRLEAALKAGEYGKYGRQLAANIMANSALAPPPFSSTSRGAQHGAEPWQAGVARLARGWDVASPARGGAAASPARGGAAASTARGGAAASSPGLEWPSMDEAALWQQSEALRQAMRKHQQAIRGTQWESPGGPMDETGRFRQWESPGSPMDETGKFSLSLSVTSFGAFDGLGSGNVPRAYDGAYDGGGSAADGAGTDGGSVAASPSPSPARPRRPRRPQTTAMVTAAEFREITAARAARRRLQLEVVARAQWPSEPRRLSVLLGDEELHELHRARAVARSESGLGMASRRLDRLGAGPFSPGFWADRPPPKPFLK